MRYPFQNCLIIFILSNIPSGCYRTTPSARGIGRHLSPGSVWVPPSSLEPVFVRRCERGTRQFQVQNWTTRRILHDFGWRFCGDALLEAQLRVQLVLG